MGFQSSPRLSSTALFLWALPLLSIIRVNSDDTRAFSRLNYAEFEEACSGPELEWLQEYAAFHITHRSVLTAGRPN